MLILIIDTTFLRVTHKHTDDDDDSSYIIHREKKTYFAPFYSFLLIFACKTDTLSYFLNIWKETV